jgi:hypothetical protein
MDKNLIKLIRSNSEDIVNPYVKSVKPLADYRLELLFENDETRIFDVKPYLKHGVFTRLVNPVNYNKVRAVAGSVEWPGEIDLSYDTLYIESHPVDIESK